MAFEVETQFERGDMDAVVQLKGYANKGTVVLATISHPPGTLRFDDFVGGPEGGKFVGHLCYTVLDEPCPEHQRMSLDKLIELGGGQDSEVEATPTTEVLENLNVDLSDGANAPATDSARPSSGAVHEPETTTVSNEDGG